MKTYKVSHNLIILDKSNYEDYKRYKMIEANSEEEALDIAINKLEKEFVFRVEEQ